MTTRMLLRWAVPLSFLTFMAVGSGNGQPPADDPPRIKGLLRSDPPPVEPAAPAVRPPAPQSVDELISRLEKLRQQKAELEKQERDVVEQLRELVRSQADRLSKLGISLGTPELKEAGNRSVGPPSLPKK